MRKLICFLLSAHGSWQSAFPQYWQQQVNYTIDVTLNDQDHLLNGFVKMEYINHSPDTLPFIWFHLWPNAYKNDKTAFSDQLLENGSTRFYFSSKEEKGYIHRLDFKVNNITAATEDHPQHIDIVKLILPSPLPPGESCLITTPFVVKLPYNFSRSGHDGQSYQATQWYPKPAVYDSRGWHAIPYLDQGEFYSEFGNFDVRITVPANYVVAATGQLQNEKEKEWLKTRKDFSWQPQQQTIKTPEGSVKKVMQPFPESSAETKTLQFLQNNVHDFAWFADKRFIVQHDTCLINGGKIIDVFTFYTPQQKTFWAHSLSYAKDALRTRSEWIGPYPYNTCSVVQGPESFGGGMEYPTITVISPMANPVLLDFTIAHEIGHNWFYGALASNERKHPWMDEGMNTFYDNRYVNWKYKTGEIKIGNENISIKNISRLLFETLAVTKNDQPIVTEADMFTKENYQLIAYYKSGAWMEYLEKTLGTDIFDKAMQEYYRQWQHKHPYPEDFKAVMEKISGRNLDSVFSWLEKKGTLPGTAKGGWKHTYFPSLKGMAEYINKPSKNLLVYGPAFGFNSYDKFMLGSFFTNYKLPPTALRFFLAPLYATGSKQVAGLGTLHFNIYPAKHLQKIDFFLNGSTFSANRFTDTSGNKFFMRFHKTVPGVRLVWREKNPRSPLYRFVQWKTYFIGEESLRFFRDTIISGTDTTIAGRYGKIKNHTTLNQLRVVVGNHRALYPFSAELKIEQHPDFIRTAFTGNYFFNYARGGGLKLRLFAGKFFYLGSQTLAKEFRTQRYHLNMTGANGYEDYTYSDFFIGRNKFEGAASQQIMLRDGGFKTRTDLLASKVGKTDNWLLAANFSSDIPEAINFLKLLPVNIPVKLFADVGTYAEAWKRNSNLDRFIFDAGIYLSLLGESVNIYLPLLYSSVFKEYIKSTLPEKNRWLKKISFIIDLENRLPTKNNKLFAL